MAIETAMRVEPERVPDPDAEFSYEDWLAHFDERLKARARHLAREDHSRIVSTAGRHDVDSGPAEVATDHAERCNGGPLILHDSEASG